MVKVTRFSSGRLKFTEKKGEGERERICKCNKINDTKYKTKWNDIFIVNFDCIKQNMPDNCNKRISLLKYGFS